MLLPVSWIYAAVVRARLRRAEPYRAPVPVVCIGNITSGGAGKTPTAIAVAALLAKDGRAPHFLTRGYRGRLKGPVLVDPRAHDFRDVGDEPLLLARHAPTWVSADRAAGAEAAAEAGADVIVMDDGYQNPSIAKDISLVVVDGGFGFGNGRVIPAGPLRERAADGLARAGAVVLVGADRTKAHERLKNVHVMNANLEPAPEMETLKGKRVVAFAGIGRPDKFFDSLREVGAKIVEAMPFPDHHPFKPEDVMLACEIASERNAVPVTTEKDFVRLPEEAREMVKVAPVGLVFETPAEMEGLLKGLFG